MKYPESKNNSIYTWEIFILLTGIQNLNLLIIWHLCIAIFLQKRIHLHSILNKLADISFLHNSDLSGRQVVWEVVQRLFWFVHSYMVKFTMIRVLWRSVWARALKFIQSAMLWLPSRTSQFPLPSIQSLHKSWFSDCSHKSFSETVRVRKSCSLSILIQNNYDLFLKTSGFLRNALAICFKRLGWFPPCLIILVINSETTMGKSSQRAMNI